MALLKKVGETTFTTVSDKDVAAAIMDPANNQQQNNVLIINKIQYQFDSIVWGGAGIQLVKIGEVTFEDLNEAGTGTDALTIVIEDGKPAGKFVMGEILKTITAFTSYTGIAITTDSEVTLSGSTPANLNAQGISRAEFEGIRSYNQAQDVDVVLVLSSNNLEDWQAGAMGVYLLLGDFSELQD